MNHEWTAQHIILPVGISFYTFQSISYAVDCHRGKARPSTDFVTFAAYLSFFPQLVAGPIERANDLLPQFEKPAVWDTPGFQRGLKLILAGLFKKVFVGDNCALVANYVFNSGAPLNAPWALLGVVAFAFQIYGDFSGYTDIARGSARLLGIRLNHNFHFPYLATSPSEFWQRWHITLSSWYRDYVYIPLGGNRGGAIATCFNLWLTMLLAGLWHGANWTFVIWGAYHGALLILYRMAASAGIFKEQPKGLRAILAGCVMFGFTLIGWAVFRCGSLGELANWFASFGHWNNGVAQRWFKPSLWVAAHVAPLVALQLWTLRTRDEVDNDRWPWQARGLAYAAMMLAVASSAAGEVQFIYFQF
jgi:D-alanyl-lipoteichoic acid acyltransferase DltB (MBOAT superfamily)